MTSEKSTLTPTDIAKLAQLSRGSTLRLDYELLQASNNPPFYPQTEEWLDFFFVQKDQCTPLNDILLEAASWSAGERRNTLAPGRVADRQGVFSTIILPDFDNPGQTLIIKIRRNASVGAGFGTFGGIIELTEASDTVTDLLMPLMREVAEESHEVLRDKAARFVQLLQTGITLPLFKCRDDTHVIDRGWGWCVDANAFATVVTDPAAQQEIIAMLQEINVTKDKHLRDAGEIIETDGIAVFSLDQAPKALASVIGNPHAPSNTTAHFYGHEALGEISGLEKAFAVLGINYPVRDHYFNTPGIVDFIAPKMGIAVASVTNLMDMVLAAPNGTLAQVPDSAYMATADQRPHPPASAVTHPACDS